jgi:superfamily II DNA/RNA helicase
MDQDERARLIQFRNGSVSYFTTDLAGGLDIPEMNHVIHYHLPSKEDEFTHRNGRTARMLATGTAYVIAHESEKNRLYQWNGSFKWKHSLQNLPVPNDLYQWWKENKLNKIDIVVFLRKESWKR